MELTCKDQQNIFPEQSTVVSVSDSFSTKSKNISEKTQIICIYIMGKTLIDRLGDLALRLTIIFGR